jgi:hypothetical protein
METWVKIVGNKSKRIVSKVNTINKIIIKGERTLSEKEKKVKKEKLDEISQDIENVPHNQPDPWDLFWGYAPKNPEEESPEEQLSNNNEDKEDKNVTDDKKNEQSDPWAWFW